MLLLFAVGLLAVPGAIAALALTFPPKLARTAVPISTLVMGSGVLGLGLGALGRVTGQRLTLAAAAHVNPGDRALILAAGTEESAAALLFGAGIGLPALLAGALCLAVQLGRLPSGSHR